MFRFVFAWQPGDDFASLAADGFVGVESNATPPVGVPVAGVRSAGDAVGGVAESGRDIAEGGTPLVGGFRYVTGFTEAGLPAYALGRRLRSIVDSAPNRYGRDHFRFLVENGPSFVTAPQLWTLLEAAGHPAVIGVALDLAAARAAAQTAAVLVPTLNLRIGLVRVRDRHDDLADYARRLAGIGFDGYVVLDPPPGPDRPAAALSLAGVFRGVFPAKVVRKPVPNKPVARPAALPG